MNLEKTDITTAIAIINKDFGLEADTQVIGNDRELFNWLKRVVNYLLEKDFERLLQAMYRIDVSEEKFKAVFAQDGDIAEAITQLVFDRELEKVRFRMKYK